MKTSSYAYKMMRAIFELIDNQFEFEFDLRSKQLIVSRHDQKVFQYLKDAGYVQKLDVGRFNVTELAQINFLRKLVKTRKSDGKLRIVIFDIPEKLKRSRNFFRRHLVELGFQMKQQSVWVSKLPCDDLVRKVIKYHGLGKYVELIVGKIVLTQ